METLNQKNEHPTLIKSASRNSTISTRLDELSSNRGNAMFPDTEMQLGMILRMKGCETSRNVADVNPQIVIDQSRLMILEDSLTVMQKRNIALIAENESVNDQLKRTFDKIRELEVKNSSVESKLEERDDGAKLGKTVEDRGISTMDFLESRECGIQAWAVCRACDRKFEDRKSDEATAIITKSELDKLEKDMQRLRGAVASRESDWERAIERENCYREQLKRLAAESLTGRQLADSRHAEIERLAQTLAENERDLRSAQREISGLKKIIVKQEKRQRELEAKCPDNGDNSLTSTEINDKELRWIDDIIKQLSSAKNKQKSKLIKEKAIYTSGMNFNSNQSSPRIQANSKSIVEPSTVIEMLSKL